MAIVPHPLCFVRPESIMDTLLLLSMQNAAFVDDMESGILSENLRKNQKNPKP